MYIMSGLKHADISIQNIRKNNGILLKSLVIRELGSNIAPNIYLEKFCKQYNDGISIECILRGIVNLRMSKEAEVPLNIETSFLTDFNQCRDRIMPRLIGTENNENLLEERPYVPVADLAVTFCIDMGDIKGGNASIPIHNGLAMSWGMRLLVHLADGRFLNRLPDLREPCNQGVVICKSTAVLAHQYFPVMNDSHNHAGTDFRILHLPADRTAHHPFPLIRLHGSSAPAAKPVCFIPSRQLHSHQPRIDHGMRGTFPQDLCILISIAIRRDVPAKKKTVPSRWQRDR